MVELNKLEIKAIYKLSQSKIIKITDFGRTSIRFFWSVGNINLIRNQFFDWHHGDGYE